MEERTLAEILAGIRPVKVKDILRFLDAAAPIMAALSTGDIAAAIMAHPNEALESVAIGAGVERAWLEEQELDVLFDLATRVIEVNADFFGRTLVPKIQAATERINALAARPLGGMNS